MESAAIKPRGPALGPVGAGLGIVLSTAALLISPSAVAEEGVPSPAEYVARVEPICKQGTDTSARLLDGVQKTVQEDRLPTAGGQFIRASEAFGKTIERIAAVPRPPDEEERLLRWLGLLRVVEGNLHKIGIDLKKELRVRANHDAIRARRSGNAANNAAFEFQFRDCRLRSSMFS